MHWTPTDLTLGSVWAVDLLKHENIVKDVILVAQGEMALEEFLKQVPHERFYDGCAPYKLVKLLR